MTQAQVTTRYTFTVRQELETKPVAVSDKGRGVHYIHTNDEAALDEASALCEGAKALIATARKKKKLTGDFDVGFHVDREGEQLVAVFESSATKYA